MKNKENLEDVKIDKQPKNVSSYMVSFTDEEFKKINQFTIQNKIKSRNKAVLELFNIGLKKIKEDKKND